MNLILACCGHSASGLGERLKTKTEQYTPASVVLFLAFITPIHAFCHAVSSRLTHAIDGAGDQNPRSAEPREAQLGGAGDHQGGAGEHQEEPGVGGGGQDQGVCRVSCVGPSKVRCRARAVASVGALCVTCVRLRWYTQQRPRRTEAIVILMQKNLSSRRERRGLVRVLAVARSILSVVLGIWCTAALRVGVEQENGYYRGNTADRAASVLSGRALPLLFNCVDLDT